MRYYVPPQGPSRGVVQGLVPTVAGVEYLGWLWPWKYRRKITISNPHDFDLVNYQVYVPLDLNWLISQGKLKDDCSDLRFTAGDGVTLLKHYKVWVKVPLIPAKGSTEIYAYYGNPNAVSDDDGDGTFEFFCDFRDESELTSKFYIDPDVSYLFGEDERGTYCSLWLTAEHWLERYGLKAKWTPLQDGFEVHWKWHYGDPGDRIGKFGIVLGDTAHFDGPLSYYVNDAWADGTGEEHWRIEGEENGTGHNTLDDNVWGMSWIRKYNGYAKMGYPPSSWVMEGESSTPISGLWVLLNKYDDYDMPAFWIYLLWVKKCVEPDPGRDGYYDIGPEEVPEP